MSKETMEWLNSNILVGFTAERGNAWHYRADLQGSEPNHYEGAIPTDDILRRLFAWSAVSAPVFVRVPATLTDATGLMSQAIQSSSSKSSVRQSCAQTRTT